jgi:hypothetical protein
VFLEYCYWKNKAETEQLISHAILVVSLLILTLETHLCLLGGIALLLLLLVASEHLPITVWVTVMSIEDPIRGEICLR